MNYLSLISNIRDFKNYLILKTPTGMFRCEVIDMHQPHPMVEIDNETVIKLRDFLNEIINGEEKISNENS